MLIACPGRNGGFTTTCSVGVDFEAAVILSQWTVICNACWASNAAAAPNKTAAATIKRKKTLSFFRC